METMRALRTDVLILGGGLAALRAAVAAREAGAAVTMAVKGKAGQSGSSARRWQASLTPSLHWSQSCCIKPR